MLTKITLRSQIWCGSSLTYQISVCTEPRLWCRSPPYYNTGESLHQNKHSLTLHTRTVSHYNNYVKLCVMGQVSHVTCHVSPTRHVTRVACHMSRVTRHVTRAACHVSRVKRHVSRVTLSLVIWFDSFHIRGFRLLPVHSFPGLYALSILGPVGLTKQL